MKIKRILTNKYTVSVLILLTMIGVDVLLHKGMSRVLLPESFVAKKTSLVLLKCEQDIVSKNKEWKKGINTIEKMTELEQAVAGFEMDVYFDTIKKCLYVYHDSTQLSLLRIEPLLDIYISRSLTGSIWLDFKNLSAFNEMASLQYISDLRRQYGLTGKMIIESSAPKSLRSFCDSNFFTSYYVPFFNPYIVSAEKLADHLTTIENELTSSRVSALSGYYFQYPVLKNYFPTYPILTWAEPSGLSLVANSFNSRLLKDNHIKIVLYP